MTSQVKHRDPDPARMPWGCGGTGPEWAMVGRRIRIRGTVQGVGFRPFVHRLALSEGVRGRVRNDVDGVLVDAWASAEVLDRFTERMRTEMPAAARITDMEAEALGGESTPDFGIEGSDREGMRTVSIPPDLPTCPRCLAELRDPRDRRFGYAFTNCTDCGPRFTIARDVPYDRPRTTMAAFALCAACRREYEDPSSRRFHAQPNACPDCGPRLRLTDPDGATRLGDPMEGASKALLSGDIVAVKGIGGYQLACDATSASAVSRLRDRKQRDEKPFAIMVADLIEAERHAWLDAAERKLAAGPECPIVLVKRRATSTLAPQVAPGSPLVGVMLAHTPLHHLLLAAVGRPLVMTSGNLSDEPMVTGDTEARERLGAIADAFLAHDRAIVNRADDSVARVIEGRPVLLRRARGYVPRPIVLAAPVPRAVLAVGAHLKNTFCLARGRLAFLGPHVGDLETLEARRALEESVDRLQRFLDIRPEVVAHDLHPDYASTAYALDRPEPKVAVQHHHAHVVSAMVEHGLTGPVIGVAFDGTGYGTDGRAWGGEVLLASETGFERVATLRPLPLAGGEVAIREVWRLALAATLDAGAAGEDLAVFRAVGPERLAAVSRLIERGVRCPPAHGAGRWFDAVGSLVLSRTESRYEGQTALLLNAAADAGESGEYPLDLEVGDPAVVDLRPTIRAILQDLRARVSVGCISARFHGTIGAAASAMVGEAARRAGRLPVVLSGGCFQNERLTAEVVRRLGGRFDVHLHGEVPPGDGGLALGQAVVAARRRG